MEKKQCLNLSDFSSHQHKSGSNFCRKRQVVKSHDNVDVSPVTQTKQINCPRSCQQDVRIQSKTNLYSKTGIVNRTDEQQVVRQLAKKRKASTYGPPRYEPGAQERIQGIIKNLYENNHASVKDWVEPENGLCGGWAALHRANPEQFVAIWEALTSYEEGSNIVEHMRMQTSLDEPDMGWEDFIISFGNSAVEVMKQLEPDAGYVTLPEDTVERVYEKEDIPMKPKRIQSVSVGEKGGGADVYNKIVNIPYLKDKKNRHHIVHIETDYHHMSVQTFFINSEVRIEQIVETEYVGVVRNPKPHEVLQILEHGIYLGYTDKEQREQTVFLECY